MATKLYQIISGWVGTPLLTSINVFMREVRYGPPNLAFAIDGRYGPLGQQYACWQSALLADGHCFRHILIQIRERSQRFFAGGESDPTAFSSDARFTSGETQAGAEHPKRYREDGGGLASS